MGRGLRDGGPNPPWPDRLAAAGRKKTLYLENCTYVTYPFKDVFIRLQKIEDIERIQFKRTEFKRTEEFKREWTTPHTLVRWCRGREAMAYTCFYEMVKQKGRRADALALRADERRDKLR